MIALVVAELGTRIPLTVAAPLLLSEFNDTTPSPHLVLTVAILLMLAPVVFNIISIQVTARVNNIAVFTEIIGTVVFGVLLFVLWGSSPSRHRTASASSRTVRR
jgi:amino acid transporter